MYTWVTTHKALVQKLLAYEHKQQELITLLKNAGEIGQLWRSYLLLGTVYSDSEKH